MKKIWKNNKVWGWSEKKNIKKRNMRLKEGKDMEENIEREWK